jgi:transcription termination factor NusB
MEAQIAQATTELVQKSQQDQQANQAPKQAESKFDGVLANKGVEQPGATSAATSSTYNGPGTFPNQVTSGTQAARSNAESAQMRVQQYMQADRSTTIAFNSPVASASQPSKIAQTMSGIISEMEQGQGRLDKLINVGLSGKEMSNTDLLALQASMYKYTQEMDLTGKVVEKATTGLKDTLKTQV